jgi:predicted DNA-binding transcriptional regulator YafY
MTQLERLRKLESFLCSGRRLKTDCVQAVGYGSGRTFQRDLAVLQGLGAQVVRVESPGKESLYYCPRAKAVFRHN